MKVVVFLSMLLVTQVLLTHSNASTEEEFSYLESSPKGPQHWGDLSKDWAACGNGLMQSPIDLAGEKVDKGLGKLNVNYKAANATLMNRGHDIMLQWESDAGYLRIDATQYLLKQIHWHTPSEHQIDGTSYDLEAHMVHSSTDGKIAVVAILYKIGSSSDSFLDKIGTVSSEQVEELKDAVEEDAKKNARPLQKQTTV
ncbi:hypothetical protein J5N97_023255 [Dioscorea zingiberensis]|uniref:Carbonic anhydrase n=1 Tax=Dioscorea zingiberensis TaxID=325984 RepID=A0A9D5CBZ2_9LILI|nr:hypothetical protein J5N97_023255 [Dioscorea zingiberensis]